MRLLVLESQNTPGNQLADRLVQDGFTVDCARDAQETLRLAAVLDYDVVIMDLAACPEGLELLTDLRHRQNAGILTLTAVGDVDQGVRALEVGADDFLPKPYDDLELAARVRAMFRRQHLHSGEVLRIADLEIHLLRRRVERSGRAIRLSATEYAVLVSMVRRQGEVLTRMRITQEVWDILPPSRGRRALESTVRRLRAKVDGAFGVKLIHTVRGVGYVARIGEAVP
jgi:two-component system copper resistance phosphate regulon response regulator CusR